MNTLDAWKSLKHVENAFLSPSAHTLLEQQRTIEDLARRYRASVFDLGALSALAKLTLAGVSAELASVARRVHAPELRSHLSEATKVLDQASKRRDIQGAITAVGAGLTSWDDMRRISDTLGLETSLERHLARISDFGTVLRGIMPEPAREKVARTGDPSPTRQSATAICAGGRTTGDLIDVLVWSGAIYGRV
ncbi:MAG: hypothetical protein A2133_07760 [Actinobacteria bacterium RBG_16_64_13]|nr:MAG: hypothetical protein A2133_07760 [Actinobacteria bacterium RBG_16_64_13]